MRPHDGEVPWLPTQGGKFEHGGLSVLFSRLSQGRKRQFATGWWGSNALTATCTVTVSNQEGRNLRCNYQVGIVSNNRGTRKIWFDGTPDQKIGGDTDLELSLTSSLKPGVVPLRFAPTLRDSGTALRMAAGLLRGWSSSASIDMKVVLNGKSEMSVSSEGALPPFALLALVAFAKREAKKHVRQNKRTRVDLTEEVDVIADTEVTEFEEGFESEVVRNVRERNPKLVAAARRKHGADCTVCGFNFYTTYGQHAGSFIEVHHLQPMATAWRRATSLDQVTVLCSNCHRMIHRGQRCLTPAELKKLVDDRRAFLGQDHF
jgi:5-methylcytosine-specific restriction protein A